MKETIKNFISDFSRKFSTVEEINNEEDYIGVKKWVKKATKMYKKKTVWSIIWAILVSILCFFWLKLAVDGFVLWILTIILSSIYLSGFVMAGLGRATMKLHSKEVRKAAWEAAKFGYNVGKDVKTEHITVSHEFADTYRVSSRTEDKGLLFAVISMAVIMIAWTGFCVYKGCFLELKKIKETKEALVNYEISKSRGC